MFSNYLKITLRNLWKNKTYSVLNMTGLAIGIAFSALIFLWVEDETSYNKNFEKRDYLYRVMVNETNNGEIKTNGNTPGPLAEAIKAEIAGIKNTARLSWVMSEKMEWNDKSITDRGLYADPSLFSMLTIKFIHGDPNLAFKELQSVVISEKMAKSVFGDENPVGKTIKMNGQQGYAVDGSYTVTGVYQDLPANSSYKFQWMSPYVVFENKNDWIKPWSNNLTETLVELEPKAERALIDKKLYNYGSTKREGFTGKWFLFSMNDWYLRSNFVNGVQDGGNIEYVNLFTLIAMIVLLIACINFMNLATARSEQRAKEVGMRKVMGAGKRKLVMQFIGESMIMSFIAVLIAVGIVFLVLPAYNELVKKELSPDIFQFRHFIYLVLIGLFTGLIAGSYPAFYLSSFNPIKVLKGIKLKTATGTIFIRKGLVVSQFAASIALIICTAIIYQQIQYVKHRDIGYDKDRLIYMDAHNNVKQHFSAVKEQLLLTGVIENAALSLHGPLHLYSSIDKFTWTGKDPNKQIFIHSNVVSPEYISTMHIKILEGRDFNSNPKLDSANIIINESMAKLMGKEGRINSIVTIGKYNLTVVGIMKDFIYNDMYAPGMPALFQCRLSSATALTIRFRKNVDLSEAIAKTEKVIKANNEGSDFGYLFVDEEFDQMFTAETLIGTLAGIFAVLAIFISCLGLFGLAAYTAERRTKEIGIRKVLGASSKGLAALLSKDFLKLVIVSCIVAFPIAWWAINSWLQSYQYRITINLWVFFAAGFAAVAIALITVSFQAIKAALANPVKSLRNE